MNYRLTLALIVSATLLMSCSRYKKGDTYFTSKGQETIEDILDKKEILEKLRIQLENDGKGTLVDANILLQGIEVVDVERYLDFDYVIRIVTKARNLGDSSKWVYGNMCHNFVSYYTHYPKSEHNNIVTYFGNVYTEEEMKTFRKIE